MVDNLLSAVDGYFFIGGNLLFFVGVLNDFSYYLTVRQLLIYVGYWFVWIWGFYLFEYLCCENLDGVYDLGDELVVDVMGDDFWYDDFSLSLRNGLALLFWGCYFYGVLVI